MPELCRCNCGYRCGGPGTCELEILECLQQRDDKHFVKDCEHKWDGPWKTSTYGESISCSVCNITAIGHDMIVGP